MARCDGGACITCGSDRLGSLCRCGYIVCGCEPCDECRQNDEDEAEQDRFLAQQEKNAREDEQERRDEWENRHGPFYRR